LVWRGTRGRRSFGIEWRFSAALSLIAENVTSLQSDVQNTIAFEPTDVIKRLQIENFRSVKNVDILLPRLSYICGLNASGKTNFSEALDFLSQAFQRGLSYAVAEIGGFYNICFRRERRSRGAIAFGFSGEARDEDFLVEIEVSFTLQTRGQTIRSDFYVETEEYRFNIKSPKGSALVSVKRLNDNYDYKVSRPVPKDIERQYPMVNYFTDLVKEGLLAEDRSLLYSASQQPFLPFGSEIEVRFKS
jgi:hypothetical protein